MTLLDYLAKIGGPLLVILGAVAFALWRLSSWCGANMVIPLRDKLMKHFENLDTALDRLATNDAQQTQLIREMSMSVSEIKNGMHRVGCPVVGVLPQNTKRPPESQER